ncbi:MAG: DUF4153 domain-containing protein [Chthoniobacterales bacterium]
MKFPGMDAWLKETGGSVIGVIRRFPFVVAGAFIAAACAVVIHDNSRFSNPSIQIIVAQKILILAVGGSVFLFGLSLAGERLRGLWRLTVFPGALLVALCWLWLPGSLHDTHQAFWFSYFCLLASIHAFVAVVPYVNGSSVGFWAYNRSLLTRFVEASIYAGVLCGGLELAAVSADKLFMIKLHETLYVYIFVLCVAIFHPFFFLSGISSAKIYAEDTSFPKILKIFTQVVLAPLCAVYGVILYLYGAKIICMRQWPDGWVAMPVLIFSVVGILAWLLLSPLRNEERDRWARWFGANFPRLLVPLTLLLLLSLRIRIREYGFTEFRVLGLVAGSWLLAFAILYSFTRSRDLRIVPGSLFVVGLLMSLGPISASHVAIRSQSGRLEAMFQNIHASPHEKKAISPEKLKKSFTSTLRYLIQWHGKTALPHNVLQVWQEWRDIYKKFNLANGGDDYTITDEISKAVFGEPAPESNSDRSTKGDISSTVYVHVDFSKSFSFQGAKNIYFCPGLGCSSDSTQVTGPFKFFLGTNKEFAAKTAANSKLVNMDAVNTIIMALTKPGTWKPDSTVFKAQGEIMAGEKLRTTFTYDGITYDFVMLSLKAMPADSGGHPCIEDISFLILEK